MIVGTVNMQVWSAVRLFAVRKGGLRRENAAVFIGAEYEGVRCCGESFDLVEDTKFA